MHIADEPITDRTWIISCSTCGRWRTLREVGGLRRGAASVGKRTLGWCSVCRRLRTMRIERSASIPHDHLEKMVDATPR